MSKQTLRTVGSVFGWAAVLGMGVATVWFVAFLVPGFCRMQQDLFALTVRDCQLMTYGGIGALKILIWVFGLCPWFAIQIVLRKM